ncbi:endothelin-converting enzyme-like 1 [Dermacentor variabilis]|uniref:endothelin-converting enzyme-like 1 n=1 Tax=Dermacentor variabilis TaxID=34621 RepID=UPI003F5C2B5B
MADTGASTSYSGSSSSSSSGSERNALGGSRLTTGPTGRPGFQRLELHELLQVRQMQAAARRAEDAAARGDGADTALDSSATPAIALPDLAPAAQEHAGPNVVVIRANWRMNPRHIVIMETMAFILSIAFLLYLGSMLWIRVKDQGLLRASSRTSHAEHADLPLFSGCHETACHKYMAAIELSINRSQDPCRNFYRFVCDGWKRQHHLLSVVEAAEDAMYGHALNAIEWSTEDGGSQYFAAPSPLSVEKKVAGLAKSCMELSQSSLPDLKKFMAARHLPWPKASRWDLLEILLDLSGNWNVHLWFHVSFELAPLRGGTGEPVLKVGHSAAFHAWIATTRAFAGQPAKTAASRRYRRYLRAMLRLFDASEAVEDEVIAKIEAMDRLTLQVLGPAMAEPDSRILRMSIRNLTHAATPGIAAGRLLLLLNEYFIWARRFSARDIVQVENAGLLRSVVYLLGLDSDTREALTLSLGLRVAHELGWMASREVADATLELAGLPPSAHRRRCLIQVESAVGIGWLSLFPKHRGAEAVVRDVRDVLDDAVARHKKALLQLWAPGAIVPWNNESFLASVLPEPSRGARFFVDWLNLMNGRWRLLERDLMNVLKPGSFLRHRWSFHGALTVAENYFVFPLFHPDFPAAVNYGGPGRLLADEVLRGLYHDRLVNVSPLRKQEIRNENDQQTSDTSTAPQEWLPNYVDLKALLASLAAYRLGIARNTSSAHAKESSLAQDRLFFVASCYALCSSGNHVDVLYGDTSHRCNEPVKALPEFAAAFQCVKAQALR